MHKIFKMQKVGKLPRPLRIKRLSYRANELERLQTEFNGPTVLPEFEKFYLPKRKKERTLLRTSRSNKVRLTDTQIERPLSKAHEQQLKLFQNQIPQKSVNSHNLLTETHQQQNQLNFEFKHVWKHKILENNTISFIGAGLNGGQKINGCDLTPQLFRDEGFLDGFKNNGWNINDCGDIDFQTAWDEVKIKKSDPTSVAANNCHYMGYSNKLIADRVEKEARNGNFVLTVGGDHSIAFGTLSGVLRARPNTVIFWIDAHADANTPAISPSGNMHGMPMGGHLGFMNTEELPGWEWFQSGLHKGNVVFIGLRDLDTWEKAILRSIGALCYSRYYIDLLGGIGEVMRHAMSAVNPFMNQPIHLSFDIDAMDPLYAPSTGTISPGGLTYREGRFICEYLMDTGCLTSMDLVEINPNIILGAQAGKPDEIYTIDNCNSEKIPLNWLGNQRKTLQLGYDLCSASLGEKVI